MVLADSDVLIDCLRGREPSTARVALELKAGSLATSTINAFELLSGVRTPSEREKVERLLAAMTILPFDDASSRHAAEIRRALEAKGKPIGTADYLIAGVCLAYSASILTRNRSHFERVPKLRIADLA